MKRIDLARLSPGGGPIAVLGVGSSLRSDDAAGLHAAAKLGKLDLPGLVALEAETAPENLTAELRRLAPSHLLIIDSADMGEPPGTVGLIEAGDAGTSTPGTHGLSLGLLADYLAREIGCSVTIVGIQPRSLELGGGLSEEVERGVEELVRLIKHSLASSPASQRGRRAWRR